MGKKYSNIILATPGLRNYWHMGPGSSETSIGPLASPINHVSTPANVGTLVPGENSGAKSYNGTSQYSQSLTNSSWNGAAAGSMECWFKENAVSDWAWIMGTDNYPTYRFQLLHRAAETNLIVGYHNPSNGLDPTAIGPYTQLAVNYVGATFGPHGVELFVNGKLVAIDATPCEAFPSTCTVVVAGNGGGSGNIIADEVATYNVRVPAGTFMQHYKAGLKDGVLSGFLLPV